MDWSRERVCLWSGRCGDPGSCLLTHNFCHGLQDKSGIIPALQKLSYAGKNLDDPQRTLAQYAVRGAGYSVVCLDHYSGS